MRRFEEIQRYFGHPGFERFLAELERKHRNSRNGARGVVTLRNLRDDEREKLDGFFEEYTPPGEGRMKSYSVLKFKKLLMERRFQLTIPELLEALSGKPVLTRYEASVRLNEGWQRMIEAAMETAGLTQSGHFQNEDHGIQRWADGILMEEVPGSRTLRILFTQSSQEAERCMVRCLLALIRVTRIEGKQLIRLPVLAAQITGDAHALDWKYPLGRLFWYGLTALTGDVTCDLSEDTDSVQLEAEAGSTQAMLIREGYRRGGVADDDLSSQVMLYAPELFGISEERVLTLRQVEAIQPEQICQLSARRILMVENPSVFAELIDADIWRSEVFVERSAATPIILCGNGHPTTAVIRLLDLLLGQAGDRELHYGGDLDPAGLGIAYSLWGRYKQSFHSWRMDQDIFSRYADRGIPMDDKELSKLRESIEVWNKELVDAMLYSGVKLHQELWLDELLQDAGSLTPGV